MDSLERGFTGDDAVPNWSAAASPVRWERHWRRVAGLHVGIIPLPVYVSMWGLLAAFACLGRMPSDILMEIAILSLGGFTCAAIGKRVPVLNHVGAAVILAIFVPSYLVYADLLPAPVIGAVAGFTQSSNFLYLFISSIIVGSILGMDRDMLMAGFLKIFVPLAAGWFLAGAVGTAVGTMLGLGAYHSFFFIVMPIMAGGVGEGAIPLSIGYGGILGQPRGDLLAQLVPPVMLGNLTAILIAGTLNLAGRRYRHLSGEGRLLPGGHDILHHGKKEKSRGWMPDVSTVAAAGVTAVTLYLVGALTQSLWHWPAPVMTLFLAMLLRVTRAIPPVLRQGSFVVYRFFSTAVTYPLLFAIGVTMTPWEKLTASFTVPVMVTVLATVATLTGTGFLLARRLGMHPIDVAIVNACYSSQGGAGDVAILAAANRLQLMPFALIATRVGGAITVTLALTALAKW